MHHLRRCKKARELAWNYGLTKNHIPQHLHADFYCQTALAAVREVPKHKSSQSVAYAELVRAFDKGNVVQSQESSPPNARVLWHELGAEHVASQA